MSKERKALLLQPEIRREYPSADFIPYACHYDSNTILTKNGELLQVIKIPSFTYYPSTPPFLELRNEIRDALAEIIPNSSYSFWFHTIRKPANLDSAVPEKPVFSRALHRAWDSEHRWYDSRTNELYLSILAEGSSGKIRSLTDALVSFIPSQLAKRHSAYLARTHAEFSEIVKAIHARLEIFGARILGMTQENNQYYSEPLQFFGKLLTGIETKQPAPICDLSEYLIQHKTLFAFNTAELATRRTKQSFASFVIKDYYELSAETLDALLNAPIEFILTQSAIPSEVKEQKAILERQEQILKISGDDEFLEATGIHARVHTEAGAYAFVASHISISIFAPDLKTLNTSIEKFLNLCSVLGILVARHDMRLEDIYWAQLPGNFSYLIQPQLLNSAFVPGYAITHSFMTGKRHGKGWETPLITFKSAANTPFFLSPYGAGEGHIAITGTNNAAFYSLSHFLLAEAQKIATRSFSFSFSGASSLAIQALSGRLIRFSQNGTHHTAEPIQINPLLFKDTPLQRRFTQQWLLSLVLAEGGLLTEAEHKIITQIADHIMGLNLEHRTLSNIRRLIQSAKGGESLAQKLAPWCTGGKWEKCFDHSTDQLVPLTSPITGFDFSALANTPTHRTPFLLYALHVMHHALDGAPTLVLMDDAWEIMSHPLLLPNSDGWLNFMKRSNAVVAWMGGKKSLSLMQQWDNRITSHFPTQIFTADDDIQEKLTIYDLLWKFSESQKALLQRLPKLDEHLFLRQGSCSILLQAQFKGIREFQVLSGAPEIATLAGAVIAEKGENPDEWLPVLYQQLS